MTKRDVVIDALKFRKPAYVPWEWSPTIDCGERLKKHLGVEDLAPWIDNHFITCGADLGPWVDVSDNCVRDPFGTVWNRTVDKDIGMPCDWPIKEPRDLDRYKFPDVTADKAYAWIPAHLAKRPDLFSTFDLGFTLYERAWTLRGMPDLLMDMIERPEFVDELLDAICDLNVIQIQRALAMGVDMISLGDDYGMQTGLIMGIKNWRRFFKPRLARMYEPAVKAGKFCGMHSCGKVDSLFEDLVEVGLNMFNPFQPEVMDTFALMKQYHGRLSFHGGMSIQKTLPFGTVQEVRDMTCRLLDAGANGGYVFSPSHGVPGDVPPENLVAMAEVLSRNRDIAVAIENQMLVSGEHQRIGLFRHHNAAENIGNFEMEV